MEAKKLKYPDSLTSQICSLFNIPWSTSVTLTIIAGNMTILLFKVQAYFLVVRISV